MGRLVTDAKGRRVPQRGQMERSQHAGTISVAGGAVGTGEFATPIRGFNRQPSSPLRIRFQSYFRYSIVMTRNRKGKAREASAPIASTSMQQPSPVQLGGDRTLWCALDDDYVPFVVTASVNTNIAQLKKLVLEERKNASLRGVDAADLVLWKVGGCHSLYTATD